MTSNSRYKIHSKRKLILLSSLAITIFFLLPRLALFRYTQLNPQVDYKFPDFLVRTAYSFLIAVVFFALNLETRKFKVGSLEVNLNKLLHAVIINVCLFIIVDFLLIRLHLFLFTPAFNEKLFKLFFHINIVLEVTLVIMVCYIYRLVFNNQQIRTSNEMLLKTNAETRYEVLKNQVNPHFLFNSFNTINALIQTDKDEATNFVNNMSDVFRYVLESSGRDQVALRDEIPFIEAYIQMLKGRHGDKLMVNIEVKSEDRHFCLPPMALHILIENAVKHNVVSARRPLKIDIFINESKELIVCNNLQEKKTMERSTGIGLSNLNQRCRYLTQKGIIIQRTDDAFSVAVPLSS